MVVRFTLLIAGEDPESLENLNLVLTRIGYRVLQARTGFEALDIARKETIHGSILDMDLSDLSGIETLRKLREVRSILPSILISSEPWKETEMEAMDVGAGAFIQKPFQEDLLAESVTRLLSRAFADHPPEFSIQIYKDNEEQLPTEKKTRRK